MPLPRLKTKLPKVGEPGRRQGITGTAGFFLGLYGGNTGTFCVSARKGVLSIVHITFGYRNLEEGQDRFEEHARPRVEGLTKVYDRIEGVRVTVSAQRNWRTVDVTVQLHGALVRAEERGDDLILAFDRAVTRMERQLARIKDRQSGFGHESLRTLATGAGGPELLEEPAAAEAPAEPEGIRIVRTKYVEIKPMAPEEAALQMELLDHNFFLFMDGDSEQVGVVYRRKAGGYGLIEPER